MGHWIPLTWLTFGLDYVLWGMNPVGYHLTSLVIFAANAAVLYFVALRLLQAGDRLRRGNAPPLGDRRDAVLHHPPTAGRVRRLGHGTARRPLRALLSAHGPAVSQGSRCGRPAPSVAARRIGRHVRPGARLEGKRDGAAGRARGAGHLPAPPPRRRLAGVDRPGSPRGVAGEDSVRDSSAWPAASSPTTPRK